MRVSTRDRAPLPRDRHPCVGRVRPHPRCGLRPNRVERLVGPVSVVVEQHSLPTPASPASRRLVDMGVAPGAPHALVVLLPRSESHPRSSPLRPQGASSGGGGCPKRAAAAPRPALPCDPGRCVHDVPAGDDVPPELPDRRELDRPELARGVGLRGGADNAYRTPLFHDVSDPGDGGLLKRERCVAPGGQRPLVREGDREGRPLADHAIDGDVPSQARDVPVNEV